MRTWTLIAAFAAASALPLLVPSSAPADGMGVRDEARPRNPAEKVAPKGSAPMAHAAKAKQGLAVPPPQPSVTITVERGVRIWRPTGQVIEISAGPDYPAYYPQPAENPIYRGGYPGSYGSVNGLYNGNGNNGRRHDGLDFHRHASHGGPVPGMPWGMPTVHQPIVHQPMLTPGGPQVHIPSHIVRAQIPQPRGIAPRAMVHGPVGHPMGHGHR